PFEPGDGAVLHLLLDVRHAEGWRPRLGRRRPARARLPAWRDGRPHDAERRRPAARGRALAHPFLCDSELHFVRSTYGYELAVIIHDGLRRMVTNQEDVYYYITLMNENYEHPAL